MYRGRQQSSYDIDTRRNGVQWAPRCNRIPLLLLHTPCPCLAHKCLTSDLLATVLDNLISSFRVFIYASSSQRISRPCKEASFASPSAMVLYSRAICQKPIFTSCLASWVVISASSFRNKSRLAGFVLRLVRQLLFYATRISFKHDQISQ